MFFTIIFSSKTPEMRFYKNHFNQIRTFPLTKFVYFEVLIEESMFRGQIYPTVNNGADFDNSVVTVNSVAGFSAEQKVTLLI